VLFLLLLMEMGSAGGVDEAAAAEQNKAASSLSCQSGSHRLLDRASLVTYYGD
jgi:hypothetical protein